MQPIYVSAPSFSLPELAPPPTTELGDLLRQVVDMQREQIALLKNLNAWQDPGPKWRAFLSRWMPEFPRAGADCKAVLPAVERAYLKLLTEVTERLADTEAEELETDFSLGEFLDRYSTRLAQLAQIINQLSPLADNAPAEVERTV